MAEELFSFEDNKDAVTVAYIHGESVTSSWYHSMSQLQMYDVATTQRLWRGGHIALTAETDGLADARNRAVKIFLEEKDADWLFWIDTDMGFTPDTVERLLAAADPVDRPIVGGLCFTQRHEKSDGMGGWRPLATPTIFDWGHDGDKMGFIVKWDYVHEAIQQCMATGSACILIHRSVFEKIEEKYGENWYTRSINPSHGRLVSEDLSFCARANDPDIGCTVWVDSAVKTTHKKTQYLAETDYYSQRALAQMVPSVPPATEPTAIIVPVLGRPQNAKPFMESLVTAGPYSPLGVIPTVYAVVDESDVETYRAWLDTGAEIIQFADPNDDGPGTFAEKVNAGYRNTDEPWLLLVGDDVRFHPGWLDHAQHAARDGAHVIGTNDLHNPRVVEGYHATHLLIRRNYIDERGASWDGPKVVCHEGYRHWYVDDEIVTVAKQRGVWAFAKHSEVEHLHPLWGGAKMDSTYELGASFAVQDKVLFEQRLAEHVQSAG